MLAIFEAIIPTTFDAALLIYWASVANFAERVPGLF